MSKRLFTCFILFLFCGKSFAQNTVVDSFKCDGVWRSYRLYVPANYSAGGDRSLILNMHGLGSNSFEQQVYTNFMPIADTAGFLMVYPQALVNSGVTYWNIGIPVISSTDDVKFLSALIDTVRNHYHVDLQRVYATGMSLGGYMSHYLALNLNDRITAIASVAGSMYSGVYSTTHPARAVPMMQIHGTADSTVPYNGNFTGIDIDTLVKFWVSNDGCNPIPVHTNLPDIDTTDHTTVTHDVYTGGAHGATCELYRIEGGEHTWPGAQISVGITNQDFSASVEIWRFFRSYKLSSFVGIASAPSSSVAPGFYPNPCNNTIYLSQHIKGTVSITDLAGRQMIQASGPSISTEQLLPGIYIIQYSADGQIRNEKLIKQ